MYLFVFLKNINCFITMIIVIADDITGAAEIAGIALKHGLDTVLTTEMSRPQTEPDVLVFATDTRSGNETDAEKIVRHITNSISDADTNIIFKKTDSVLRGHIVTELKAIMDTLDFEEALLLPQNPSKGRVIKNGTYYINGLLLDKTDFNRDPEFPAQSSFVKELLKGKVEILGIKDTLTQGGKIFIADSENNEDIKTQIDKVGKKTLLAGGADLFTTLLQHKLQKEIIETNKKRIPVPKSAIIICGSTQSKNITEEPYIRSIGAREEIMPYNVFCGDSPYEWIGHLSATYEEHKSIIISIGEKENGGKDCAVRLRGIMAEATIKLIEKEQPELMVIEGGATAYAILNNIGWNYFKLKREYAPGIVSMTYGKTEIILKPGSYPWGDLFKMKKS